MLEVQFAMQQLSENRIQREKITANAEQAVILLNPAYRPVLAVLMGGCLSVQEMVKVTGQSFHNVYRQVKNLEQKGIASIVCTERRAGKPIHKYYIQNDWLIPYKESYYEAVEQLILGILLEPLRGLSKQIANQLNEDNFVVEVASEKGECSLRFHSNVMDKLYENNDILLSWSTLSLKRDSVREFIAELKALYNRFQGDESLESEDYLIGLFATQLPAKDLKS